MSLNFDISKVKDYKDLWVGQSHEEPKLNPITTTLIFGAMFIGIGEITIDNVDEVWERFYAYDRALGPLLIKYDKSPRYLTYDDIVRHIGLSTNVFPKESMTKFRKKLVDALFYDAKIERNRTIREKEKGD